MHQVKPDPYPFEVRCYSIGQISTYPLAMLSTRHMATVIPRDIKLQKRSFVEKNMMTLLWKIGQKEGIGRLYRSLFPNFMKSYRGRHIYCLCIHVISVWFQYDIKFH
ncbi:uncharacterized protein LOC110117644 [Ceratitis capitata]|uniref:uncharacterized protein LOC110117644 n=1 Tax=Ceratitis capitata TaxID=7213 RepID=UPI000A10F68E|nr:uncharacterized protein LOC110117644 [Ceratitis capitata]